MLALLFVALAGCGRAGFDLRSAPDAAPDGAPPALSCAPPRFSMGISPTGFTAIATRRGYEVFATDSQGVIRGSSYVFGAPGGTAAQLATEIDGAVLHMGANGQLGAVAIGDDVLLAASYDGPPGGTDLIAVDDRLALQGMPQSRDGSFGAAGSLARNQNGTLVFASQPKLQAIDLQIVSPLGASLAGAPVTTINDGGADLNNPSVLAANTRFVAVWNWAPGGSPNQIHAQVLSDQLAALAGPVTVSPTQQGSTQFPRAAYAPAADRYLIAWHQKATSGDEVWFSLRDGQLGEVASDKLAAQGIRPVIAAGDNDFLVVWQDGSPPSKLSAARIAMNGAVSHVPVASTGGTAGGWDLVARDGQPALVWAENGGTGPNLWIDPLCP